METRRDIGWWYWFITVGFLATGLLGWTVGLYLAMGLCAVQIAHVIWRTRDVTSFPVQVRVTYLSLLVAGLWWPLQWIHWVQLVGTSARVLVGYCFLARTLSLAPWNRWPAFTLALIRQTYLSRESDVSPCGAVFRHMALEQVQGGMDKP